MIKIVFLVTACKGRGPIQQTLNIIKNLDRSQFESHLVTLYPEEEESLLSQYLPWVTHHYAPTSKIEMLTGRDKNLRRTLEEIQPDVIHSLGVFPDFAVSRMKRWRQIITLRNYVWEDYPAKFGRLQGGILAWLHLYSMKHTAKTVTCSESLAHIYKEKLGLSFDYVRNGVDVEQYTVPSEEEKQNIRRELNLPANVFIFAYTGQMIERKNVGFLLETFASRCKDKTAYLLLLGGGALLDGYISQYGEKENIDFRGNVSNVSHWLKACDAYVSTSTSEGLPNGVLEAMATGLPVVLSDIPQHQEIYNTDKNIGHVYRQGNADELAKYLHEMMTEAQQKGYSAYQCAQTSFSALGMSKRYQALYRQIVKR